MINENLLERIANKEFGIQDPPIDKLYIWKDRTLYLGAVPVLMRPYTIASHQFSIGLDGKIKINTSSGDTLITQSCLLRAGTTIDPGIIENTNKTHAVFYLNPVGHDYSAMLPKMQREVADVCLTHQHEAEIVELLTWIKDHQVDPKTVYSIIDEIIGKPNTLSVKEFSIDPRVVKVVELIKETVRDNLSVSELADRVFLSESRLVKLFKQEIGIPITKYRIRYRIFVGVIYLSLGYSVTEAALAAGFSDTAHFSKCYCAMLGIKPSLGFLKPPFIQVMFGDEFSEVGEAGEVTQTAAKNVINSDLHAF